MRLVTFTHGDSLRLGVMTPGGTLDVFAACEGQGVAPNLGDPAVFYRQGLDALAPLRAVVERAGAAAWRTEGAALGPCVPTPEKIICVGTNYRQHAAEANMVVPTTPLIFGKYNNALTGHGAAVPLPAEAVEYDYEAELVVVIGRAARSVPEARALDYVLGYCNGNDLSARDLQFRTSQWLLGKTLDGFLPVGPAVVTADEVSDPQRLAIRCWVNGELRQDSNTSDMVFPVAAIIAYLSRFMTLRPGDLIATGTPQGVMFGKADPRWLRPGDEVTVEIGPLGRLVNRMVEA